MHIDFLLDLVLIGLTSGCLYSLVALGYSIVYGVVGVINFSHGEVYAFGAYVGYVSIVMLGLPLPLAFLLSAVSTGCLALMAERLLFRPLSSGQNLSLLVAHIGLSVAIRSVLALVWGERFRTYRTPNAVSEVLRVGGVALSLHHLLVLAATALLGLGLWALLSHSRFGRALRAVSQGRDAAAAKGLPVVGTIAGAYALGGFLAGAAGVLAGHLTELTPQMGVLMGVKAFTASVLGGIGRPWGAVVGGLVVGVLEALVGGLVGGAFREAFVFGLLAVVLLAFPRGIMAPRSGDRGRWSQK